MSKEEILEKIKKEKPFLKEKFHVSEIGLFGSYARGDDTFLSDVDILYDIDDKDKIFSLFDLVDLKSYLENLLKRTVDIVDKKRIKPFLKEGILKELVII